MLMFIYLLFVLLFSFIFYFASLKFGFVDKPDLKLKNHARPTSFVGGVFIFASYFLGYFLFDLDFSIFRLVFWSVISLFVGFYDDINRLGYKIKLVLQLILSFLFLLSEFDLSLMFIPYLLFMIVLMNSINIIDNYNGVSGFSYLFSFFVLYLLEFITLTELSFFIIPLLVFLFANARKPGKALLFLGNNGSYAFGFLLTSIFLKRSNHGSVDIIDLDFHLYNLILIFLPYILDTTVVFVTRLVKRMNPLKGSHDHLSHILLNLNFKPFLIGPVLFLVFQIFSFYFLFFEFSSFNLFILIISVIFISALLITERVKKFKNEK